MIEDINRSKIYKTLENELWKIHNVIDTHSRLNKNILYLSHFLWMKYICLFLWLVFSRNKMTQKMTALMTYSIWSDICLRAKCNFANRSLNVSCAISERNCRAFSSLNDSICCGSFIALGPYGAAGISQHFNWNRRKSSQEIAKFEWNCAERLRASFARIREWPILKARDRLR